VIFWLTKLEFETVAFIDFLLDTQSSSFAKMYLRGKIGKSLFFGFLVLILITAAANGWIIYTTKNKIVSIADLTTQQNIVLVLGTSKKLSNGAPNPFFENRIKTAAYLFKKGFVSRFILSGDNRTRYYNEPYEMKKSLIKAGVPDSIITLDFAGLRTLDSIVRTKEIFGQNKIIIITQTFHCYRALFISLFYHMDAVAIAADEPDQNTFRVYVREYFARTKAVLDLYIFKTTPRHMGDKQSI
jgi:SanA protein